MRLISTSPPTPSRGYCLNLHCFQYKFQVSSIHSPRLLCGNRVAYFRVLITLSQQLTFQRGRQILTESKQCDIHVFERLKIQSVNRSVCPSRKKKERKNKKLNSHYNRINNVHFKVAIEIKSNLYYGTYMNLSFVLRPLGNFGTSRSTYMNFRDNFGNGPPPIFKILVSFDSAVFTDPK